MTCHCVCKCDNLLTITDRTDICRQCWKGAHKPAPRPDDKAYGIIINRLHDAFCGTVPGYEHADLFGHHEEVAQTIFTILKGQSK